MFFPFFVSLFFRYPSNERNLPLDRFDGRIAVLATAEHFSMNVNQSTEIFTCNCTLWNKPKSNWLLHFLSNHLVILCIIFNSQIQFQIIVIVSISSHLNSTKKNPEIFFQNNFFSQKLNRHVCPLCNNLTAPPSPRGYNLSAIFQFCSVLTLFGCFLSALIVYNMTSPSFTLWWSSRTLLFWLTVTGARYELRFGPWPFQKYFLFIIYPTPFTFYL